MNIRFKFTRNDDVKYISHLDMMKMFERALRRSGLPVAYSQGFNPHPDMVFGLPLSVGVTSDAEYADFGFSEFMGEEKFIKEMNEFLPDGFLVTSAGVRQGKANIMASIGAASYEILVSSGKKECIESFREGVKNFLSMAEIKINKETKSGVKEVDIRPMILDLERYEVTDEALTEGSSRNSDAINRYSRILVNGGIIGSKYNKEELFCIHALLSAGSASNLKPELLIKALNDVGCCDINTYKIHRTGLYINKDGQRYEPLDTEVL
ncbi:MAG TPA: TIGR03936 family radical SAM-associated protein [Clostridia bacterium]